MSKKMTFSLGLAAILGFAALGSGCGGGSSKVVIIVHNGHYGYYTGSNWCDFTNNYCGTGASYGIVDNGCYYNGAYCSTGSSGGSTGGSSGGGSTGGSTGGGGSYGGGSTGGSTGGGSTGGGSTGGGSTGGGSTGGGSTGGGSTGGGSTGGGSTGGGSTGGGGGSYGGGGGSYGGGGGSYGGGSTGGSSGGSSNGSSGFTNSTAGATKDVDLQRAAIQIQDLNNRANALASQFQMNFESARQLTQLADQMQALTAQGQMTDLDRDALARSALGVVGVSPAEVQAAMVQVTQSGSQDAVNLLMNKAASNLGMTSSAALRDQILPSLGINLNSSK